MVRESHDRPGPFGRRDVLKVVVAVLSVIAVLAAGVAGDLAPLNDASLGRAAAWMLLGTAVSALMLAWLWRFRPEYWARSRTLILIGLIAVVSILAVKLPGGRPWVPYVVPAAASGMVLTLLLDSASASLPLRCSRF